MNNNKGSTLIELLIAITIFAMISVPFYKSIITSLGVNYKSQYEVEANLIAQKGLEEFLEMDKDTVESTFPKTPYPSGERYEVTEIVTPVGTPNSFVFESPKSNPNDTEIADFYVDYNPYNPAGNLFNKSQPLDLGTEHPLSMEDLNNELVDKSFDGQFIYSSDKAINGTIQYAYPTSSDSLSTNYHSNPQGADDILDVESSSKNELEIKPAWIAENMNLSDVPNETILPDYFYILISPEEGVTDFSSSSTLIILVNNTGNNDDMSDKIDIIKENQFYKYTIEVKNNQNNVMLKGISTIDEK